VLPIRELPELSGIAAGRREPGRLWAHNDSGEPILFALDENGRVSGRVTLRGARVEDWEAVAVGTCASGSCIYVGDIGDNDAVRRRITVYRIPEGGADETTADAEAFHATYPEGPQDAETLLVTPAGRLFVVTKGETGPVALYAFPSELRPGDSVRLQRIGSTGPKRGGAHERVTDGAVSPDGQWVVLRSTDALSFHRAAELLAGNWREARRVSLEPLGEPQGEGVTFGIGDTLFLAGEGGGGSRPGTLVRFTCSSGD
jgi:hypothetical protein